MNKILVLLNSSKIGGAERSILNVVKSSENKAEFKTLKPSFQRDLDRDRSFFYPKTLYQLSRDSHWAKYILALSSLLELILSLRNLNLNTFDKVWLNGNKVAYPALLLAFLTNKKDVKFYWFWRDYPQSHWFTRIVITFFSKKLNLEHIANSLDVEKTLKKVSKLLDTKVFYPMVEFEKENNSLNLKNIAVPAMFAPWKGIHEVLIMATMYETELRTLGIEKIYIYGGEIYATKGPHTNFSTELKKLAGPLVEFMGVVRPDEIFENIGLVIHSSIGAEPFGRVLIESFASKVPVISTSLGGAAQLVEDQKTGLSYQVHDYHGLYRAIETMIGDKEKRENFIKQGWIRYQKILNAYHETCEQLL